MNTFDDERERAFEKKFALDQELAFKVAARRNALTARWAAHRMHLHGAELQAYVRELVEAVTVHAAPEALASRILADLLVRGVPVSKASIDTLIAQFTSRARAAIIRGALR